MNALAHGIFTGGVDLDMEVERLVWVCAAALLVLLALAFFHRTWKGEG